MVKRNRDEEVPEEEPEKVYKFASVEANPDADYVPWELKEDPFVWTESDKSVHSGAQYTFPTDSGLPDLRVDWRAESHGTGLQYLFMATTIHSDYSILEAEDHPNDDSHYRDTLWDPWVDPEQTFTEEECIAEMQRRYRGWLKNIHPDPLVQLQQAATDLSANIVASAQQHQAVRDEIIKIDPTAEVPGISADLVAQVIANDPTLIGNDQTPNPPA